MDPLKALAGTAITEGVKFLYLQAGEFLSAWRGRRRDADARAPRVLEVPAGVTVTGPRPMADPPGDDAIRVMEELRDLAEPIQSGEIGIWSPAALAVVEQLRDVVEAALQAPIRFNGEPLRPLTVADIRVTTERVAGRVTVLRADLAKLPRGSRISGVHLKTGDVLPGGDVNVVDLS